MPTKRGGDVGDVGLHRRHFFGVVEDVDGVVPRWSLNTVLRGAVGGVRWAVVGMELTSGVAGPTCWRGRERGGREREAK